MAIFFPFRLEAMIAPAFSARQKLSGPEQVPGPRITQGNRTVWLCGLLWAARFHFRLRGRSLRRTRIHGRIAKIPRPVVVVFAAIVILFFFWSLGALFLLDSPAQFTRVLAGQAAGLRGKSFRQMR